MRRWGCLRPRSRDSCVRESRGLGSNVGDAAGHLRAAVEPLEAEGIGVDAVSSAYVTEPVGEVLDQPDFLNAAVRIRTDLEPEELLGACKRIEAARGSSLDAPLDVDLLLLGHRDEHRPLTVPHREVTTRRFVLVPLLDLDPEMSLPDGAATLFFAACLRIRRRYGQNLIYFSVKLD